MRGTVTSMPDEPNPEPDPTPEPEQEPEPESTAHGPTAPARHTRRTGLHAQRRADIRVGAGKDRNALRDGDRLQRSSTRRPPRAGRSKNSTTRASGRPPNKLEQIRESMREPTRATTPERCGLSPPPSGGRAWRDGTSWPPTGRAESITGIAGKPGRAARAPTRPPRTCRCGRECPISLSPTWMPSFIHAATWSSTSRCAAHCGWCAPRTCR